MIRRNSFILLLLILLLCPCSTWARQRDAQEARMIASRFRHEKRARHLGLYESARNMLVQDYSSLFCISWCHSDGRQLPGFLLVPKEDSLPEVLAYDSTATFPDTELPPHVAEWIRCYEDMASLCVTSPESVRSWLEASHHYVEPVGPLLQSMEWGQENPYNLQCPEINGVKAPTGCVATALSQIMRYHRWPASGVGEVTYLTGSKFLPVHFNFTDAQFEWEYMKDSYNRLYTQKESNAVSTLMAAVGAAVKMDYNTKSSGANNDNAVWGLRNYLKYDADMFVASAESFSDVQWHTLVQEELMAGRPIYYTGGGGMGGGHAFVIDGMEVGDDGFLRYHVNWGWDGLCNGYYLLNMLRPEDAGTGGVAGSNYAVGAEMIVGLMPEDDQNTPMRIVCKDVALGQDSVMPGQSVAIHIDRLTVLGGEDFAGRLQVILNNPEDSENEPILVYEEESKVFTVSRGLSNYDIRCVIPENIPAGRYDVQVVCTRDDATPVPSFLEEWPRLGILSSDKWFGGEGTQPRQCLGLRGAIVTDDGEMNSNISVHVDSLVNIYPSYIYGDCALMVCDVYGRFITHLDGMQRIYLMKNAVQRDLQLEGAITQPLADGRYMIAIGFRPHDDMRWSYAYGMDDTRLIGKSVLSPFFFPMEVVNGEVHVFHDPTSEIADSARPLWNDFLRHPVITHDLNGLPCNTLQKNKIFIRMGHKYINKYRI